MRMLALDLGTRCGWAFWDRDGSIQSGVQTFDLKRGESPGMRYLRFNKWLDDLWMLINPTLVIYEQTLSRHALSMSQSEISAGLSTRVQEWCARHQLEHTALWPATLKKWFTGKGNADKATMRVAAKNRFKIEAEDDNEVDALALLHYARAEFVPKDGRDDERSRGAPEAKPCVIDADPFPSPHEG